jgi:opacity protein-like surface antigen
MVRTFLLGATSTLALTTAAMAETAVKEVEVTADLSAVANPQAAAYWTRVADDLQAAIVARVTDMIDPDGARISIDIDELALANSFQEKLGMVDAALIGQVNVSHDSDNTKFDAYRLTVSMDSAKAFLVEGIDPETDFSDEPRYYAAMVSAFADGVVQRLK